MRDYLNGKGYLGKTPILQPVYGGAAARPLKPTLLYMPYLRIANELYLNV